MEDLTGKVTGGNLSAAEWNQVPQEMQNVITKSGSALAGSGNLDQLGQALATYSAASQYLNDTGAADAYVLAAVATMQLPVAYVDGMIVRFRPGNANATSAPTARIGALANKTIAHEDGSSCVPGDLDVASDIVLRFDATADKWFLPKWLGAGVSTIPRSHIIGMTMQAPNGFNHTNTTSLFILPGACRDFANTGDMVSSGSRQKFGNAAWNTGTGGMASGAKNVLSATSSHAVFAIGKTDGSGDTDFGYDNDLTAANLLSDAAADGFTTYRQIGWVFGRSATHIERIHNNSPGDPNFFYYQDPLLKFTSSTFTVGVREQFPLPAPAGHCVIRGSHFVKARTAAAASVTDLYFLICNDNLPSFTSAAAADLWHWRMSSNNGSVHIPPSTTVLDVYALGASGSTTEVVKYIMNIDVFESVSAGSGVQPFDYEFSMHGFTWDRGIVDA